MSKVGFITAIDMVEVLTADGLKKDVRIARLQAAGGKLENALLAILDRREEYQEPPEPAWFEMVGNARAALREWKAVSDD